jgi:hypothetical protein
MSTKTVTTVLVMVATLWRIPSLVRLYNDARAKAAAGTPGLAVWFRAQVAWMFVGWLQDLPFIPLVLITLPCLWRSPSLVRHIRQVPSPPHSLSFSILIN